MKPSTTSKKKATPKRREPRKLGPSPQKKVIKPYFPFLPPDEPERYELDQLCLKAKQWHDKEAMRLKKPAMAELQFLSKLQKAGLLGHENLILVDGDSGKEVDVCMIHDLLDSEEVGRAGRELHEAGELLVWHMRQGNVRAAEALWGSTVRHVAWLQAFATQQPELLRKHACLADSFPVLATLAGGWEEQARDAIGKLDLGSGLARSRLKPGVLLDESHVCRRWAARAIRTLDHNRHLKQQLECVNDFLKARPDPQLVFAPTPAWAEAAATLPPLSTKSFQAWKTLTRQMLADQMPNLHARPEFKTITADIRRHLRKKFGPKGDSEGRVLHALLDKIISAMRATLRPDT